jgi:molybdate transport system substrate-binding protein
MQIADLRMRKANTVKKSLLILTWLVLFGGAANGAQLRLLVSAAMAEPVKKVGADFERKAGHQIDLTTDTSGALQNKLRAGEKADVIIVSSSSMDALEKEKRITAGTRVDLARALVGVAMRTGAKPPDLSSAEAFKRTMLAAKSVAFVDPKAGGTLGTYISGLFEKMGIAAEMQKKTVFPHQASEVAAAVAKGDAELGITFTSEVITNKGVKLAGLLPDAIQLPTIYVAAVPVGVRNPDAARAFLQAMQAPPGLAAIKDAGLELIQEK